MTGPMLIFAVFGGAFLAGLLLVLAFGGGQGRARARRIASIGARASGGSAHAAQERHIRAEEGEKRALERVLAGWMPRRAALRERLARAGMELSVGRYALICVMTALMVTIAIRLGFGSGLPLAILIGVTSGILLPHKLVSRRIEKRITRFTQLFPEAIDLMVRGLKSGLPISETIVNVGEECPAPVGTEFRNIADSVRLGKTLEEALWDTAGRLDTADFKFFVISLSVQRETGGNLGETLGNLADILRKRQQMKLKVKAVSSEARASAYIIGSLPFAMFLILSLMNPDYAFALFNDPRGLIMTAIGGGMMLLGAAVMFKMVKFEI